MSKHSAAAKGYSFVRPAPTPEPPVESDAIGTMRRELRLLRIDLERLRGLEDELRMALAYVELISENRDEWQREAERLGALLAKLKEPLPSLCWWRK